MPTVHVAVLDQDKDMLTGMLRSLPTQGDAARHLRLHFVENREEGLRLVEKDKVSALVVLPKNMTEQPAAWADQFDRALREPRPAGLAESRAAGGFPAGSGTVGRGGRSWGSRFATCGT